MAGVMWRGGVGWVGGGGEGVQDAGSGGSWAGRWPLLWAGLRAQ
jgi:hypothetical protein